MSAIKDFLADPANYTEETRRILAKGDPWLRGRRLLIREPITCADGFLMSVQYSAGHYCNGRSMFLGGEMDNERTDPLPEPKTVEIGFPSEAEPLLAEYAEEPRAPIFGQPYMHPWGSWSYKWRSTMKWLTKSNLTETVYGWVPIEVVDEVIAKHGGIKKEEGDDRAYGS